MLSALTKYGLIEVAGEGEARLSELAMRILYPDPPEDRAAAMEEAGFKPTIFSELREKWPSHPPSDDALRSHLIRRGFSEAALEQVIQFYREIIDIAKPRPIAQTLPVQSEQKEERMSPAAQTAIAAPPQAPPASVTAPPLAARPFTLAFDGDVLSGSIAIRSVRDIDRLMKVLQAQKGAFEAMVEDPEEELQTMPDEADTKSA
jgi:hypothetical protein